MPKYLPIAISDQHRTEVGFLSRRNVVFVHGKSRAYYELAAGWWMAGFYWKRILGKRRKMIWVTRVR